MRAGIRHGWRPSVSYKGAYVRTVIYRSEVRLTVAKNKNEGFSSSAGLMRYFDSEDAKGIKVGPRTVIAIAIIFTVVIAVLPVFFPMS